MRWVVKLATGPAPECVGLYLPRAEDEEAFHVKLPVTIWRAATFRSQQLAFLAVEDAKKRGFPVESVAFEKTYPRSFTPEAKLEKKLMDSPRPTGKPAQDISIEGKVFPWRDNRPVYLQMPGSPLLYLPLFSDVDKLKALMDRVGTPFDKVKQVDDSHEFLASLAGAGDIQVILDPYFLPNGRVRFLSVQLEGATPSV